MIVDRSALMAILLQEPDALAYASALGRHPGRPVMSAATLVEASIVADRKRIEGLRDDLDALVADADIEGVALTPAQAGLAREAFRRFDKGTGHAARLNFGDCLAHALARERREPFLFKGNDFPHTDIPPAL